MKTTHYALIDDQHLDAHGGLHGHVVLDCITEQCANELPTASAEFGDLRDSKIETLLIAVPSEVLGGTNVGDQRWLNLHISSKEFPGSYPAQLILLGREVETAATVKLFVMALGRLIESSILGKLKKLCSLAGLRGSTNEHIMAVLNDAEAASGKYRAAAVLDVGQANCNALITREGCPWLFYDLGWPLNLNKSTAPATPPKLFACETAENPGSPVILSHWDFDHWGYAVMKASYNKKKNAVVIQFDKSALRRFWIVPGVLPNKPLGPTHRLFIAALRAEMLGNKRALTIWPKKLASLEFNGGAVVRCSPTGALPNDRNNTGLALFLTEGVPTDMDVALLFPGDADFGSVPRLRSSSHSHSKRFFLAGLVASHHGGMVNAHSIPEADEGSKLAVSVGQGNTYSHPNSICMFAYRYKGWSSQRFTMNRFYCCGGTVKTGTVILRLPGHPYPSLAQKVCAGRLGYSQ